MARGSVLAVVALAALLLPACGGGGGGGGDGGAYLTADPRGASVGGADPLAGGGAAAPGAEAADFAGDVATEIESADLHRVDGDRLVLLNAYRGLTVVDLADPVEVVSRLPLAGYPNEMFLRGDRALVFHTPYDGVSQLVVVSLADPAHPAVEATFGLGGWYVASRLVGDVVYVVTDGSIRSFATTPSVVPVDAETLPHGATAVHAAPGLFAVVGGWDGSGTPVDLVDASDPSGALAVRGGVEAPGWVADEWKLDVAGGVLRLVAHDGTDGGLSHLRTYDLSDLDAPAPLGSLDLARGEQLFATRFSGDVAYVVTFEQVDPLWVIDLRDPAAPAIAGELVVPGWSTHLVPAGTRLVAVGMDPADGHVTASLFDVADPELPTLLDRADFGWGWTQAFSDPKALGVFEERGLVTLPLSGESDRVAVLALGATTLDLRGEVALSGTALRGFPHGSELVAFSTEEVVVVDASTLAVRARATLATNVVDAMRLSDGSVATLEVRGSAGRLGDVALPLVPSRLHPFGDRAAVVGFDDLGPCAYVVDLAGAPALSARFALGSPWWGTPDGDVAMPGVFWGGFAPASLLTNGGRLVVHGLPGAEPFAPGGRDGFVVIDVGSAALAAPIEFPGRVVSGFAADGETLAVTLGAGASPDDRGRPRVRHDLVLVDLATGAAAAHGNVPGYVVAADAGLVFLADEQWGDDWSFTSDVVAVLPLPGGTTQESDRQALPVGAFDLRAAGATLFFTTVEFDEAGVGGGAGGGVAPGRPAAMGGAIAEGEWGWPTSRLSTMRLGSDLALGPAVEADDFRTLLLPEDGSALVVRAGVQVERWDLSGPVAVRTWTSDAGAYPVAARADAPPGAYLVALGYGGLLELP